METKLKKDRLKKVERRRRDDEEKENQKFLEEVLRVEEREIRRQDSAKKNKAARSKADREEQECLEEALRMQAVSTSPTSTPPPTQSTKMPPGEESWWELKEENVQTDECAKSKPVGAKPDSVPGNQSTKLKMVPASKWYQPANVPGYQSTKLQEHQTSNTNPQNRGTDNTKIGTTQDQLDAKMPRKSSGRQKPQQVKQK